MATIFTKVGNFEVSNNGNGSTIYKDGCKVAETPIAWWNKDELVKAIEENKVPIEEKLKENAVKRNKVVVTKENAVECLNGLLNVLGNEEKGFYSSRLKQCINKLTK